MKLTKLFHSSFILEANNQKIAVDASEMNEDFKEKIDGQFIAAIFTHIHGDHYSTPHLQALLVQNPKLQVFASQDTADKIRAEVELSESQLTVPELGKDYSVGSFTVSFFGERHAHIVPGDDKGDNVGFVVNHSLVYAGDSFDLPGASQVSAPYILAVPTSGPWLKIGDSVAFLRQATEKFTAPEFFFPIHDGLNGESANRMMFNHLDAEAESLQTSFKKVTPGESFDF